MPSGPFHIRKLILLGKLRNPICIVAAQPLNLLRIVLDDGLLIIVSATIRLAHVSICAVFMLRWFQYECGSLWKYNHVF